METNCSPGPWEWDSSVWDYDPQNDAPFLLDANGNIVVSGEIKCNLPNARLIASAPELLEALLLLKEEMVLSGNAGSVDYGWKPAIKKTIAAIAKATGKE